MLRLVAEFLWPHGTISQASSEGMTVDVCEKQGINSVSRFILAKMCNAWWTMRHLSGRTRYLSTDANKIGEVISRVQLEAHERLRHCANHKWATRHSRVVSHLIN